MSPTGRTIFIVSADSAVIQGCIHELDASGGHYLLRTASSVEQARREFYRTTPSVVFLDESAVEASRNREPLESAVALLSETAPVVVAAAPEKQASLAFLITSGAVDFVAHTDHFLTIAAGMLDRRARMADRVAGLIHFSSNDLPGGFRGKFRHGANKTPTGLPPHTQRQRAPPRQHHPAARGRPRSH